MAAKQSTIGILNPAVALQETTELEGPEAKMTDNALMESFFHSMKVEGVHGTTFPDQQRLDQHVNHYMPFYSNQRMHSALGYVSPVVFEQQFVQNSVST